MKVLVTGATGFVASHLIPALLNSGHDVIACGHHESRLAKYPAASRVVVDLRDRNLAGHLPTRIDAVIHLAQANVGFPDGFADLWEVNAGSTARLLDWARHAGATSFVFASTGSVYEPGERPWHEDDPVVGGGAYAATKVAAERIVGAFAPHMSTVILRLFGPYGVGQRARLVPGLVGRVLRGDAVSLREGGRPRINPVWIGDVVEVFIASLGLTGNHTVNLAGDEVLSIRDMATIIGEVAGRVPVFEEVPGSSGGDTVGDTARLRKRFGKRPLVPFRDGVAAVVADALDTPR
ncbi:MAG: NAD(P)-dependent oxidoreductase [Chloroflexi bacterium]|nr:NAD(P)-dependent oxidoreductase [Chloroflexota bacterium]